MKETTDRILRILKRCDKKLNSKDHLEERDYSKSRVTTQLGKSIANEKEIASRANVTEYSNHFKVNSTISPFVIRPLENINYSVNPIKKVNRLDSAQIMTIDEIKNNYATSYNHLDRGKYRRSISQQRNITLNDNLSKIVNENWKKENEIENVERLKQRLVQIKQNNDLK